MQVFQVYVEDKILLLHSSSCAVRGIGLVGIMMAGNPMCSSGFLSFPKKRVFPQPRTYQALDAHHQNVRPTPREEGHASDCPQ